jgi:hypothetical protein
MKVCLFLSRSSVFLGLFVLIFAPIGGMSAIASSLESHSPGFLANIRGNVTVQGSALPVAGARVRIQVLNLDTITDSTGKFAWTNVTIRADPTPADVRVSAPGYGDWLLKNALVRRDDTLILNVDLRKTPTFLNASVVTNLEQQNMGTRISAIGEQSSVKSNDPLPATIRVGITGNLFCTPYITMTYTVQTVDFKSYVKHVLPNEWLYTWNQESLRAGAMAVKMYAWYWINLGGKWRGTDMIDSVCDQVYNPAVEYASTNQAVDYTWNWKLTRQGGFFQTSHKDTADCSPPNCMNQSESALLAYHGYTWDQILAHFYPGSTLSLIDPGINAYMLRFNGNLGDGPLSNLVEFPLLDPSQGDTSLPINVGAGDFTIELWLKTAAGDNNSGPVSCGDNQNWNQGNIILDRSQTSPGGQYGLSLARNRLVFGITSAGGESLTLCGVVPIADNRWHHIAIQRRRADGMLWMFVDGQVDGYAAGPQGDISFPPGSEAASIFDPYLFLGGGKTYTNDLPHPFFKGWIDEMRFSKVLRYPIHDSFLPPDGPFKPDSDTLALYHFDDGVGISLQDTSGATARPTNGRLFYGGQVRGPEWTPASLFIKYTQYIPLLMRP